MTPFWKKNGSKRFRESSQKQNQDASPTCPVLDQSDETATAFTLREAELES